MCTIAKVRVRPYNLPYYIRWPSIGYCIYLLISWVLYTSRYNEAHLVLSASYLSHRPHQPQVSSSTSQLVRCTSY